MAFLRFTRDKRGYEHFYLVEATTNRRGKTKARVLYWFRTPPGVKVGREPFDPEVRRALESQNPDVRFDWRKIVETPIPSADAELWRERRRLERARRRSAGVDGAQRAHAFGERRDSGPLENGEAHGEVPQHTDAAGVAEDGAPLAEGRSDIAEGGFGDAENGIDEFAESAESRDIESGVAGEAGESGESGDLTVDAAEQQADALAPTEDSLVSTAASIEPDEVLRSRVALASVTGRDEASGTRNAQLTAGGPGTHEFRRKRRRRRHRGRGPGGTPRPSGD